jgi:hypothetical protein
MQLSSLDSTDPFSTALEFDRSVAERAICDTARVALDIAATSVATIQKQQVQSGAIPEL